MNKLPDRIEKFIEYEPMSGCWLWTGTVSGRWQRGMAWWQGRMHVASRVLWELTYGPFDKELQVLHKCDNPNCVNPSHLFLGTQKDNMHDMQKKGRKITFKGESASWSKLTEYQVLEIRASNLPHKVLSKMYNIGLSTVSGIQNRYNWKHI